MNFDFTLHFLEHKDPAWSPREAPDAYFFELVELEERLALNQEPSSTDLHLSDHLVIPKVAHVAKLSCENDETILLDREEHLLKEQVVHVIVIDKSGAGHEIEMILEPIGKVLGVAEVFETKL